MGRLTDVTATFTFAGRCDMQLFCSLLGKHLCLLHVMYNLGRTNGRGRGQNSMKTEIQTV
jgi:hypothetical protein